MTDEVQIGVPGHTQDIHVGLGSLLDAGVQIPHQDHGFCPFRDAALLLEVLKEGLGTFDIIFVAPPATTSSPTKILSETPHWPPMTTRFPIFVDPATPT